MRKKSAAILFSVGLAVASAGLARNAEQAASFDGTWQMVAFEIEGKKAPAEVAEKLALKMVLKGDNYVIFTEGKQSEQGKIKLDTQKKPNPLDFLPSEGSEKGKTLPAIAEVNGDTMKICLDTEAKTRPTEFLTKADNKFLLATYKREVKK